MRWRNWLEYLLNAGRDPLLVLPKDLARVRIICSISYIYIFTGLIIASFHFMAGLPILGIVITSGIIIGFINLYLLFYQDVIHLNAHLMVAIIFTVGILTNLIWGGYVGPNFTWLLFVPVLAGLAISFVTMWVYMAIIVAYMFILIILQNHGIIPLHQGNIPHEALATILNRFSLLALICMVLQAFYRERIRYENKIDEASRRARIANQQKDEFIATMTHEIRTPLTGIMGMAELLMKTNQTNDQKYYTKIIHESGHSLIHLINDTLDYSKIESGKLALHTSEFNLHNAIESTLSLLAKQALDKGIDLNYYAPPDLPQTLLGDEMRYKQILSNLVNNAIKFTEKGEVSIRITFELQPDCKVVVTTHVKDTGLGISKANQKKIFESFTQADNSILNKFGGTGLGLTIAQRLTHMMGGTIWVESQLDKGSDFGFTCQFKLGKPTHALPLTRPYCALCIGLSETENEFITRSLEEWNIFCTSTQSSFVGLNLIQERINQNNPVDFIFVEYSQTEHPEFIELCEILSHQNHKTHIIALHMQTDIVQPKNSPLGLIHHLQKPIRQSDLYGIVLAACGSSLHVNDKHFDEKSNIAKGGHILVAEDNVINQALIRAQLDKLHITCDIVSDGQEAINALNHRHYDLVIMDSHMPVMDGIKATEIIRTSNTAYQHIPIIALTADSLSHDLNRCISAGMDDFIIKPFKQMDFQEALSRWMKGDHGHED